MLVALFRHGPRRHRIRKGLRVLAPDGGALVRFTESLAVDPGLGGLDLTWSLESGRDGQHLLVVDSGWLWLCEPEVRQSWLADMSIAYGRLAAAAAATGVSVLPGGLRTKGSGSPPRDEHLLEAPDSAERCVLANSLTAAAPELIALSAQPGWVPGSSAGSGSYRLGRATDHVPATHFQSMDEVYLGHLQTYLRQTAGIPGYDLMDVDPTRTIDGVATVAVRLLDSQTLLRTTLSHAVLLQAVAVSARRSASNGIASVAVDSAVLNRNRARAIASDIDADLQRPSDNRGSPSAGSHRKTNQHGHTKSQVKRHAATERISRLVEVHRSDLISVRATPEELAGLTLGISIARGGRPALRTEADLVRRWSTDAGMGSDSASAAQTVLDPGFQKRDWLTELNRAQAGVEVDEVMIGLTTFLTPAVYSGTPNGSGHARADAPGQSNRRPADSQSRRPGRGDGRGGSAARRAGTMTVAAVVDADRVASQLAESVAADPSNTASVLDSLTTYFERGGRSPFRDIPSTAQGPVRATLRHLTVVRVSEESAWNAASKALRESGAVVIRFCPAEGNVSDMSKTVRGHLKVWTVSLGRPADHRDCYDVVALPRGSKGSRR